MWPRKMRDAAYHLEQLERRLFNRDSEELLLERLGEREMEWVMKTGATQPDWLNPFRDELDQWLTQDLVLPSGPFANKPQIAPYSEDEDENRRHWRRCDQSYHMRNSFGMGVFVGAGIFSLLELAYEQEHGQQAYVLEINVKSALELLKESPFSPRVIDGPSRPWPKRMQELLGDVWTRTPLNVVLAPIPRGYGFFRSNSPPLTPQKLDSAKRCMMLAGLISSGLELPPEEERDVQPERSGDVDLFNLSDEALEDLLGQAHLRESIQEELRYRLRTSRLGRMLAHLERTSKDEHEDDEHEDNGAAGDG